MNREKLYQIWKQEEDIAHIHGWDFSHIHGRYDEERDLPWDYDTVVKKYLDPTKKLMDFDTGGAEYLLSLNHPFEMTSATEGYEPNVELCKELLLPKGIDFRECSDCTHIPYSDESFDVMINRHGSLDATEIYRLLKKNGIFITEQVGAENDRDLTEMVLPGTPMPFPEIFLSIQKEKFEKAGFTIVEAKEAYRPIKFFDIGAFVWFARIIEWEFPGFSVDRCFEKLLEMQSKIENDGVVEGTIHRFLLVAKKL